MNIRPLIHKVHDFPTPGIVFWDIMDLLNDHKAFAWIIDQFGERYTGKGIDLIAAPESRGFLFGCPLAHKLKIGFVPIRKPGKLPRKTMSECFLLEYGETCMEMHHDAIQPGQNVLLIDDVLATGGTAHACATLIERQGGIIAGMGFLLDLQYVPRIEPMKNYDTYSLLTFTERDVQEAVLQ